jgi:hypothetical protein
VTNGPLTDKERQMYTKGSRWHIGVDKRVLAQIISSGHGIMEFYKLPNTKQMWICDYTRWRMMNPTLAQEEPTK